jgi:hypothetical protein
MKLMIAKLKYLETFFPPQMKFAQIFAYLLLVFIISQWTRSVNGIRFQRFLSAQKQSS